MTIPKIIHQTYKNHNLPETYKMCQTEIKRLHPDFEYRFLACSLSVWTKSNTIWTITFMKS